MKFAIANPEHAPYGRAAMEALQSAGLWTAIEPTLVLGENVSQAAQFAVSGSTQGGIFALSLALWRRASCNAGSLCLLRREPAPAAAPAHGPDAQGGGQTARDFYAFLQGPVARAVFKRYGFVLPGETAVLSRWIGSRFACRCGSRSPRV